jgi:hypothetical protein
VVAVALAARACLPIRSVPLIGADGCRLMVEPVTSATGPASQVERVAVPLAFCSGGSVVVSLLTQGECLASLCFSFFDLAVIVAVVLLIEHARGAGPQREAADPLAGLRTTLELVRSRRGLLN